MRKWRNRHRQGGENKAGTDADHWARCDDYYIEFEDDFEADDDSCSSSMRDMLNQKQTDDEEGQTDEEGVELDSCLQASDA